VETEGGELLPYFLFVSDGEWEKSAQVVTGNERVLRARLADARFYWEMDLKKGLDALAQDLAKVVWLEPLGSLAEKGERVTQLVDRLGRTWYADSWSGLRKEALRAARLAKADLGSEMIKDGKEFTGLQGTIGARYAEAQGEDPVIVDALAEQYLPAGAGGPLPESPAGTVLAAADRLDTVAGCWAAGFVPSGSQDPYALRRAANGIVRILLEKELHLAMGEMVEETVAQLPEEAKKEGLTGELLGFFRDRIAWALRERGISYDVVDAVLAADSDDPMDAMIRAEALQAIRGEAELERLVVGFKRAANILKGIDENELPDPGGIDWKETHAAEQGLHEAVTRVREELVEAGLRKDYPAMLRHLLELRAPIDTFFDDVLVMAEDAGERTRRLALLAEARELFHHLFDPARIVIEGENAAA
jgi:glycyl-tRNA synthetase beta chain